MAVDNEAFAVLYALIDGWIEGTETGRAALRAHGGAVQELRESYLELEARALVQFTMHDDERFSIEPAAYPNRQARRAAQRQKAKRSSPAPRS